MSRILLFNKPFGVICQFSRDGMHPALADYIAVNLSLTKKAVAFTVFAVITQEVTMTFSRGLLLLAMLFSLGWSVSGHAAASKTSASITGTWYSAQGKTLTFRANGTISYHGKRYYYAVSSGGYIQLKGKHGDLTIPYQLAGGKLTLTEEGKIMVYRRRR